MLRFFRLLRRKFLEEGHVRKYFWYALGEILLVMIGILLALQVNNWNQNRLSVIEEEKLLREFKSNLESNIDQFESNNTLLEEITLESMNMVLHYLETEKPENDTLYQHFHNIRVVYPPNIVSSAYTRAKSNGFNTIKSDTLIQQIISLYDVEYDFMKSIFRGNQNYHEHIGHELNSKFYSNRLLLPDTVIIQLIPTDYDLLLDDDEFYNRLSNWKQFTEFQHYLTVQAILKTETVIKIINDEIE